MIAADTALRLLAVAVLGLGASGDVVAGSVRGAPVPQVTLPGGAELPDDAVSWCGGHVSGAPQRVDEPGPHLLWAAYTTGLEVEALTERYAAALGREPDLAEDDCATWRFPPERPVEILQVCPTTASGPWSECEAASAGARSVILASTRALAGAG
jgi:hypothetical protein